MRDTLGGPGRQVSPRSPGPERAATAAPLSDRLGRPLRDLRISVTDRCNFRCGYCVPPIGPVRFRPHDQILSFEEIERVAGVFLRLGVRKIRLTGGEPLLRYGLDDPVGRLVALPGLEDLGLTTNGYLLAAQAGRLRRAGLRRITVRLDAIDGATFRRLAGVDVPVSSVLAGIDAAIATGFAPVKLNSRRQGLWSALTIAPRPEYEGPPGRGPEADILSYGTSARTCSSTVASSLS